MSFFLERRFPLRMLVVLPLLFKMLPRAHARWYMRYVESLWRKFFTELGAWCGEKVVCTQGSFAQYGSQYYAYRVEAFVEGKKVRSAYGQSLVSPDEALAKAVGEFIERTALYRKSVDDLDDSVPYAMLDGQMRVFLDMVPAYLPWQKKEMNERYFVRDEVASATVRWVPAYSFLTGKTGRVPAERALWGNIRSQKETVLNEATTNGGGGGFTRTQSVLSGLYELIERDSFLCFWLLDLVPQRIDPATVPLPPLQKLLVDVQQTNMELYFLDITTTLGVPAVCAVVGRHTEKGFGIGVGAACGHSPERLFMSSVLEAMEAFGPFDTDNLRDDVVEKIRKSRCNEKGIDDTARLSFWRSGQGESLIAHFLSGEVLAYTDFIRTRGVRTFSSPDIEQGAVALVFQNAVARYGEGYHPYVYKAHSFIRGPLQYFVSKAVVASLCPLYLREDMATLDIRNIPHWKDTARAYGMAEQELMVKNFTPHPFP